MVDILSMAQQCAPSVAPHTLAAVARVESSFNPYAIGVVGGYLQRQPRDHREAVAIARELERRGYNFSLGMVQINRRNLAKYGETYDTIFDVCRNMRTGAAILNDCFVRAKPIYKDDQQALRAALSCYYSGNFSTGFAHGYVDKVVHAAQHPLDAIVVLPAVRKTTNAEALPREGNARSAAAMAAPRAEPADSRAPIPWAVGPADSGKRAMKASGLKYESSMESE
jgi:type IV secretion system protein VirB1